VDIYTNSSMFTHSIRHSPLQGVEILAKVRPFQLGLKNDSMYHLAANAHGT